MLATIQPRRLRVLVVDDDVDTVDSTAKLLRVCGNDVKTALRGIDAVECTARFHPEVVMLDTAMPGMDGYQTAREIQRLVLPKSPVLIAVSGYGDIQAQREAAESGFDLHLLKPVLGEVFEELHLLVEERERASTERTALAMERVALTIARTELSVRRQQAMLGLTTSYIQTARTMLDVARTTRFEDTRERCISKTRRICNMLSSWIARHPEQLGEVRGSLEALIRLLPERRAVSAASRVARRTQILP